MKRLFITALLASQSLMAADLPPVQSVPQVDLARYVGTWHEIARFPMYFQNQCVGDITANYSKMDNGKIKVINRCRTKEGEFDQAEGSASVVENTGNAQLKVSFFWPFRADYWIIGLDPEYRWAVVGNPNRKYLWILSRSETMAPNDLAAAKTSAVAQGFDLTKLMMSELKSAQ
ncbi:lipocalin family protein [Deefgea tanakiae]|uniref:Outer membrane lipoprotein Blc n=1 Tax=Deefgea tanakiae TaxID=2865840 RepID=A0ABX8Z638_9NEIS|nr:lipocalin family protein [Deefgea tanakiae]QZA78054.1 lipocalin family protein [Deefgea tanakiae]